MIKEKIFYSHEAQIDVICESLAKLDLHEKTIKIDISGDLSNIYLSDKENFVLLIRSGLDRLLRDTITMEIKETMTKDELDDHLWFMTQKYNIVLEGNDIRKVQDVVLIKAPQFCDVVIIGKGPREAYARRATFQCAQKCELKSVADATREIIPVNEKCMKHELNFVRNVSKDQDDYIQRLIIQEPLSDAKHSSQIDYDARIVGGMLNETFVGQKKRVFIAPRSFSKAKKTTSSEKSILFDVLSIVDLEEKQRILPTYKEVEEYRKAAESPDYFYNLLKDFAPNVVGDNLIPVKTCLMLSIVGGVKTEGHRGSSHILLIGDPSVGKSQLLKECAAVSPKHILTDGGGSSAAGLTIGMVKRHDGTMVAQAGVLPLCDNGIAIIDEFDKMSNEDKNMMHPAMEDQSVHIAKAGTELTLPTRTTVIAACNPKFSRWNENMPMRDNINLTPTMLSRFDYVFFIPRTFDPIKEGKIASRILHQSKESTSTIFEKTRISTLLNYAATFKPRLDNKADDYLHVEYVKMVERTKDTDIPADGRTLAGLIRSTTAIAKLKFKDVADVEDAKMAVTLKKAAYLSFGIDLDNTTEQTHLPSDKKELNKHETFWLCFNKLADDKGTVSKPEVIELMAESKYFIDVYGAKKFFEQMCTGLNQQLLEGPDGRFRRIT